MFPTREVRHVEVDFSPKEREMHEALRQYIDLRRGDSDSPAHQGAMDFVAMILKKRLFSSPLAFSVSMDTHLETMRKEAGEAAAPKSPPKLLRSVMDRMNEVAENDEEYAEAEAETTAAVRPFFKPLTPREETLLVSLRDWAGAAKDQDDNRFGAFKQWLDGKVRDEGQRVIVFTEYRDTQRWLYDRITHTDYRDEEIAQLYGGQDDKDREDVKHVFQASLDYSPVRILLATDAASEGINLQNHCHTVFHWEIPWNPNRLEQRNGRVDRHGQRAERVEIFHFVPEGWNVTDVDDALDARKGKMDYVDEMTYLAVVLRKIENIRTDLGSAGDVIADHVERVMTGTDRGWSNAAAVIERRHKNTALLKAERDFAERIQAVATYFQESRTANGMTAEAIEQVVRTGLWLEHRTELIDAVAPESFSGRVFRLPALPAGAWARARGEGLGDPLTGRERLVTFDQEAMHNDRRDIVLLHLKHPLVDMCQRLLRAEVWQGSEAKLNRVTARVVPGDLLRTPAVVAHGRVVVTGNEGTRLHEEIVIAGGRIEDGQLVEEDPDALHVLLNAASQQPPGDELRDQLTSVWHRVEPDLTTVLRKTAERANRQVARTLAKRCKEEVDAMRKVIQETEQGIRSALAHGDWAQPSLFEEERQQLHTNKDALEARLAQLPELLESETDALRRRYADPTPRWFPAAVTFLVPVAMAQGGQ